MTVTFYITLNSCIFVDKIFRTAIDSMFYVGIYGQSRAYTCWASEALFVAKVYSKHGKALLSVVQCESVDIRHFVAKVYSKHGRALLSVVQCESVDIRHL